MLTPVMHGDGQADHFGKDCGTARPGFDHGFAVGFIDILNFPHQVIVNKRAFFERSAHPRPPKQAISCSDRE
jgi:hypothetical protein